MKRVVAALLAGVVSCAASQAWAEPSDDASKAFGARPSVLDVSLSPSGQKLAFIVPAASNIEVLYVIDLANGRVPRPILQAPEIDTELSKCDWATDAYLVCVAYGQYVEPTSGLILGFSRMFSLGDDGSNVTVVTPRTNWRSLGEQQFGGSLLALDVAGEENKILVARHFVPESTNGTRLADTRNGLAVEEVDLRTGRRKVVVSPDPHAIAYRTDETGAIRIKARQMQNQQGFLGDVEHYSFRSSASGDWQPLGSAQVDAQTADGFVPITVDATRQVAYGFDQKDGFSALYAVSLDGKATRELVLAKPSIDVDGLIRIGRSRRVVGATFATERRTIEYFDPYLRDLARKLGDALPGQPLINIIDASRDESKLLIIAGSDVDPGKIYLFDKSAGTMSELLAIRANLDGRQLAEMKPVTFKAADGTPIPAYLTLPHGREAKNLPAIVLPHGGPSSRDEWGFDWLVQFFAAKGYAVLQPNYRGSSGMGREWFGRNGFQDWRTAIGDVNDAGRWLATEGIADPARLALAGWSYGGYAALQSQVLDPQLYKAIVAIAPVADLEQLRREARRYQSGQMVSDFIGAGEHISSGSPARHADRFAAPVLLFHGDMDQNVAVEQSRLMKSKLEQAGKRVEYVEYARLDHGLDDSAARIGMLEKIDAFLGQHLER